MLQSDLALGRARRAARVAGALAVLLLTLAGCATLPARLPRGPEGHALSPQPEGPLADLEAQLRPRLMRDGDSGYRVLDSNEDALRWRLALVDSARHSLDIQYYFWWQDESGELLMKRVVEAADRGVKVRVILDDLSTLLEDDRTLKIRDWQASVLNAHPNIELRLFNAFRARSFAGRAFGFLRNMDLMNQRMHNKMLVADNRAVILGGRNVGNEYFGFAKEFNFRDLDLLGVGAVSRQASNVFDRFWNSEWVVPVSALELHATQRDLRAETPAILEKLVGSEVVAKFPLQRADWSKALTAVAHTAHIGNSRVLTDVPAPGEVRHRMPQAIRDFMKSANSELLITNAYVIPDEQDIEAFRELHARGVKVRMLTNSLASQDVPAVNSHYKRWRKPLIDAGVELYESRPDAADPHHSRGHTSEHRPFHGTARESHRRRSPHDVRRLDEPRPALRGAQQRDGRGGRQRRAGPGTGDHHGARHAARERLASQSQRARRASMAGGHSDPHAPAGARRLAANAGYSVHAVPTQPLLALPCLRQATNRRGETVTAAATGIDRAHRKVIFASSLGTVFEWYDFYLYGSLSAIISRQFFAG